MEFTAEDAKELIRAAWVILSSPLAQRVYVLVLITGLLSASLFSAKLGLKLLRKQTDATRAAWNQKKKGPPTRTLAALSAKIAAIIAIYLNGLAGSFWGFLISLACGVFVPAVVLLTMVFAFPWFDAGCHHLIEDLGQPVEHIGLPAALLFVADQTLRGGLFDLIEIFAIDVAHISNNPACVTFSLGLFGYHLFVEAFILSGLLLLGYNALVLGQELLVEIKLHQNRHNEGGARRRSGPGDDSSVGAAVDGTGGPLDATPVTPAVGQQPT